MTPAPYDPAPIAMLLLALLIVVSLLVVLLSAVHCLVFDPSDIQCQGGWAGKVRDMVLELAPILIALVALRKDR